MPFPWPAAIGAVASLVGGRRANIASAQQARNQMRFQERMSSTAHQREIQDLKKAGLNPILSATGGSGASTPGGAMAMQQDVITPAVNSALQIRRQNQEVKNLKATQQNIEAQTRLTKARIPKAEVLGDSITTGRDLATQAFKNLRMNLPDLIGWFVQQSNSAKESIRRDIDIKTKGLGIIIKRGSAASERAIQSVKKRYATPYHPKQRKK